GRVRGAVELGADTDRRLDGRPGDEPLDVALPARHDPPPLCESEGDRALTSSGVSAVRSSSVLTRIGGLMYAPAMSLSTSPSRPGTIPHLCAKAKAIELSRARACLRCGRARC